MKNFATTVIAASKSQLESWQPFIWTVSIKIPSDPPTRIRLTNFTDQIERGTSTAGDPLTYYPFPMAIGDFKSGQSGDLPSNTLNIANVSREMQSYLHDYKGLVGQEAIIRFVRSDALADPLAEYKAVYQITGCQVEANIVSFTLGNRNLQAKNFPANTYTANHCRFRFGTSRCGYVIPSSVTNVVGGGFDFCGRTLEDCEERGLDELARSLTQNHPLRFGAYPGTRQGNP